MAPVVIPPPKDANTLDLDRLAYAVAMAETGDCTKGAGLSRNNCFGLMSWKNGVRYLRTYKTKEESYIDFKKTWSKYYKRFPDMALARTWTGNQTPKEWLANVSYHYQNT